MSKAIQTLFFNPVQKTGSPRSAIFALIFWAGVATAPPAESARLFKEKDYQAKWCGWARGETEVRLESLPGWASGKSSSAGRVDCLTRDYAIEFDFAKKWAEAIGQSLYYQMMTGRKAGIVLIIEKEKDYRFLDRLNQTIRHFNLNIRTWIMKREDIYR